MITVEARHINFTVQGRKILEDINLLFPAGRRTAILGANGSGKSTLLRIVAGFSRKYEGTVLLDGRPLAGLAARSIAQKMAVLPQAQSVPHDLTVEQLVAYGRFPYRSMFKRAGREDAAIIAASLAELELSHMAERRLETLSGGELQKVWLAMAICQQPQVLLLDEPTTYLDVANQIETMQILAYLNQKHQMTIIMVLHDVNHARIYADYAAVLHDHHLLVQGEAETVISRQLLAQTYQVKADLYENQAADPPTILFPNDLLGNRRF